MFYFYIYLMVIFFFHNLDTDLTCNKFNMPYVCVNYLTFNKGKLQWHANLLNFIIIHLNIGCCQP